MSARVVRAIVNNDNIVTFTSSTVFTPDYATNADAKTNNNSCNNTATTSFAIPFNIGNWTKASPFLADFIFRVPSLDSSTAHVFDSSCSLV